MKLKAKYTGVLKEVNHHSTVTWDATTPKGHECLLFSIRCYSDPMKPFEQGCQVLERITAGELVELTPTGALTQVDGLPARVWHGRLNDGAICWVLVATAAAPPAAQAEWDEAVRQGAALPMATPNIAGLKPLNANGSIRRPH